MHRKNTEFQGIHLLISNDKILHRRIKYKLSATFCTNQYVQNNLIKHEKDKISYKAKAAY